MKPILSFLTVLMLLSVCVQAQDVLNPNDPVYTYSSSSAAGSNTNPNTPPPGVMAKWVRTVNRISWDATKFKCYYWNGMAFRLRFPNNYNPAAGVKYPVIVFFHGGGEIGPVTDNEDQLFWGAQDFEQRINAGEWNGFLLFPQETSIGWDNSYFSRVNDVLDTMLKYNSLDPDRVIAMGLSSGGYGAISYAQQYPQRVASCVASAPEAVSTLNGGINGAVHIPVWLSNGGTDTGPDPFQAGNYVGAMHNAGANCYQTYLADEGHIVWSLQWNLKDVTNHYILSSWWNNAQKSQPLCFFNNNSFCDTGSVNAHLGITQGYYAYEWQVDNGGGFVTIPDATGNEYTATQAGKYRVHFKRTADANWSAWSPNPVVIKTSTCAMDTLLAEHFEVPFYYYAAQQYKPFTYDCQNGIATNSTYNLTQDGTGRVGGTFLLNNTGTGGSCSYAANDEVWHNLNPVTVQPHTNYQFSFSLANRSTTNNAKIVPMINGVIVGSFAQAPGSGDASWKKFKFIWNSGDATIADLHLLNQVSATSGNDFALDEIVFGAPTPNVPPVANAGADITINLPTSTTTLNGSASSDPDGSIAGYAWTQLSGPAQATIANASAASTAANGLQQGVYTFRLVVTDDAGATAADTLTVTVNVPVNYCGPLPANVSTTDVGGGGLLGLGLLGGIATGQACFTAPSTYTIKGAGDLNSSTDKFRFVYKTLTGNGTMIVKVTSQDAVSTANKAGLMFRNSLNSGASYVFMGLTSGDGAYLQSQVPGLLGLGTTVSSTHYGSTAVRAPYYIKLVRNGSTFTGYVSTDSITWVNVGSKTVSMSSTSAIYVGLAVCSQNSNTLSTAVFDGWKVLNSNGQVVNATANITGGVTTETLQSIVTDKEMKVYPNPSKAGFTVDFSVEKKQNVWIAVTGGADGRTYYSETLINFSGSYHKDLGALKLAKGNYAVTVRTAAGIKTIILIKQ